MEADGASARLQVPTDPVEARGLPGPVRTDDRAAFPRLDRHRHTVDRGQRPEAVGQVPNLEEGPIFGHLTARYFRSSHRSARPPGGLTSHGPRPAAAPRLAPFSGTSPLASA